MSAEVSGDVTGAGLRAGDTVTFQAPLVTRSTLALYAGASGDHNPVHIDIDECRAVGIPDVFAHGMLSMAYLGRLLTDWVDQRRIRSFRVRFCAITPVRVVPTCTATVADVVDGRAHVDLRVKLPDGTVTLLGSADVDADPQPALPTR
ncbi:MAG TPA: MaoC/PaaZ C-terminal domain-containing protein [Pseudonocardia sp.]|nr:MaoC/PaaZ C-terminal domain-containing protein [Pseudonocardia sp.]